MHSLTDRLSITDSKRVSSSIACLSGVDGEIQVDVVILNLYPVGDMICSIVFTVRSLHRVAKVGAERIFRVKSVNGDQKQMKYEMYLLAKLKRRKLAYSRSRKSGDAK